MQAIFVVGTAGSGKSLLCAKMHEYYTRMGVFAGILNMDPGVESLPYAPEVDVRDYVDVVDIMKRYDLGPNGGLVMASDMAAARMDQIQRDVDEVNPDYLLVDTPGQVELFAYRSSGPFITSSLQADVKTSLFMYDGATVCSAANFLSISLLASSIRLRLRLSNIGIISKADLADSIPCILEWSADANSALQAVSSEVDGELYSLLSAMIGSMDDDDWDRGLIPVSSATGDGLADLESALSRILNMGEEVED